MPPWPSPVVVWAVGRGSCRTCVPFPGCCRAKPGCAHTGITCCSQGCCAHQEQGQGTAGPPAAGREWGCPQSAPGQPQSAAPLPGTQHFPSQLGQFLPPEVEQVLRRAAFPHCPQPRAAPHHSQSHSIPSPSSPYSPTVARLATGAALGRTKGRTSQPQGDHCT